MLQEAEKTKSGSPTHLKERWVGWVGVSGILTGKDPFGSQRNSTSTALNFQRKIA